MTKIDVDRSNIPFVTVDNIESYAQIDIVKRDPNSLGVIDPNDKKNIKAYFFKIDGYDDLALKISRSLDSSLSNLNIRFVKKLIDKQRDLKDADLPRGYVIYHDMVCGQIIKFYHEGMTLADIFWKKDITELQRYFKRDDNPYLNLICLYEEILKYVMMLYESGLFHEDISACNMMIVNNKIKVIDFDRNAIYFGRKNRLFKYNKLDLLGYQSWMAYGCSNIFNAINRALGIDFKFEENMINNSFRRVYEELDNFKIYVRRMDQSDYVTKRVK